MGSNISDAELGKLANIDPIFIVAAKKIILESEEKAPADKLEDPTFEDNFGDRVISLGQLIQEIRENRFPGAEFTCAFADILKVQNQANTIKYRPESESSAHWSSNQSPD